LVALIYDFLKRHNQQLRELALELKVRREEENKLIGVLTALNARLGKAPVEVAAESAAVQASAAPLESRSEEFLSPEALAAMPEPVRALSRAHAPAARSASSAARAMELRGQPIINEFVSAPSARSATFAAADTGPLAADTGPLKDWSLLLAAQRNYHAAQAGFQSASALNKLIEGRRPFSGLIVSIGVDAGEAGLQAARPAIESLLQAGELGGPTGSDEFILLLPAERGASAQRRVSRIAQQLWDFQLGSLGRFGVQFSWGGVEVRNDALDEAVASAAERMRDTRRGRQSLTAHGAAPAIDLNRNGFGLP
jgi:hypothetical protein